jgi:hypothetical protein
MTVATYFFASETTVPMIRPSLKAGIITATDEKSDLPLVLSHQPYHMWYKNRFLHGKDTYSDVNGVRHDTIFHSNPTSVPPGSTMIPVMNS